MISNRAAMASVFAEYAEGEKIRIRIEEWAGPPRSRAQEQFFHGPVLQAFMSLGYSKEEAKDLLAFQFIPVERKGFDGTIVRLPGHTSSLTKDEYSQFIKDCVKLAADLGLEVFLTSTNNEVR